MTSNSSIYEVSFKGVVCKSDCGLFERQNGHNSLTFLSIYGAPQQTRAIFSALASNNAVEVNGEELYRDRPALRYRSTSIGYAKQHALIWTEEMGQSVVVYTSEEERLNRLRYALSKRRIPYDPARVLELEQLLLGNGYLEQLEGWGPVSGYRCVFDDDTICALILSRMYGQKVGNDNRATKAA
jgi:hypothetical protein